MNRKYVGFLILLVAIVAVNGCIQLPQEAKKPTIVELQDLALTLSDLPNNFTLYERVERPKVDISQEAIVLGWKTGYSLIYTKDETSSFILQWISIYPAENISKVIALPKNRSQFEGIIFDELSKPDIGDDSKAYRVTMTGGWFGNTTGYQIEFIKNNVYETIRMSGGVIDYELLKDLAKKAEAKIN